MKMSSDQKKNMGSAIKKIKHVRSKILYVSQNYFIKLFLASKKIFKF